MKINYSPVLTSQNYGTNFYQVEDSTFDNKNVSFSPKIYGENVTIVNNTFAVSSAICDQAKAQAKTSKAILIEQNNTPVKIDIFQNNETCVAGNLFITLNEYTSRDIIINIESETATFANLNFVFNIKKSANANVTILSNANNAQIFLNIEAKIEENAKFKSATISAAANEYVLKHTTSLLENSTSETKCLYLGKNKDKIDLNIISEIHGKFANSTINVVGALNNFAEKSFKGTIDFKQGATKSYGDEKELCLMFSPSCKSKALPILLCAEEDVEGSHSAATGKIDESSLFYIMSRGISKRDAIKMVSMAKFANIIQSINDEETKNKVLNLIDRNLDNV